MAANMAPPLTVPQLPWGLENLLQGSEVRPTGLVGHLARLYEDCRHLEAAVHQHQTLGPEVLTTSP